IRRNRVGPATAVDAVFTCVEIDVEIIKQVDGEAPKNLVLALQLIFGEFILSGENTSFQCHDYLDASDCRLEPFNQPIVKFSREIGVASEAICEDDEPETGKLGVKHEVLVGCHNVISFMLMTEIGHSVAKRGQGPRNAARKRGNRFFQSAAPEKLGETAPSLTPDLLE
ncbi:hypothetical protein HU757_34480, partial [Rhizobium laguerreae]|nr:hypothetical protein [Rhizobium laguerreae]